MSILLALSSAVVYGVADWCGGRASRFHPSVIVTLIGQVVSFVLILLAVLVIGTPVPAFPTFAWGLGAGAAGAVGLTCLYYAFANGAMTVVAPISAVVGAGLPAVVGLALGERPEPIAYVGIAIAIASVALVSGAIGHHERPTSRRIMGFAVAAGTGFGLLFVGLERTDPDSGMWPLVAARSSSVPLLVALALLSRVRVGPDRRVLAVAVVAGALDMAANVFYLEAVRGGLLSVVGVVSSLYPASTVALAFAIDRERVNRWQAIGMTAAAGALVMVTLGR
ncbi:MAG: EamA family transporter [Ilumatobacteraceae bacterium]